MNLSRQEPRILPTLRQYWNERVSEAGIFQATSDLVKAFWSFLRDSTPARLRSLYGDAEYDWDHRVNTTSGAVGWRERLLGVFHSPYQPTEPALFGEMMDALRQQAKLDLAHFTFIDLGSGKGRTLLMASDYPFRRIIGVELLPALHEIARQNMAAYKADSQQCLQLETVLGDATAYAFPPDPLVVYLFNPFPKRGLERALTNLAQSLRANPRPAYVLYHNPQLEKVVLQSGFLAKIAATHQYSIFAAGGQ